MTIKMNSLTVINLLASAAANMQDMASSFQSMAMQLEQERNPIRPAHPEDYVVFGKLPANPTVTDMEFIATNDIYKLREDCEEKDFQGVISIVSIDTTEWYVLDALVNR